MEKLEPFALVPEMPSDSEGGRSAAGNPQAENLSELAREALPPTETRTLGAVGIAAAEAKMGKEPESLLDAYRFTPEQRRTIAEILSEAETNPRVDEANKMLHELGSDEGDPERAAKQEFAREAFIHQRDVAEVAVGLGMVMGERLGISSHWLRYFALAGLTHDLDKGNPKTAAVFMKKGVWDSDERKQAQGHPVAAEQVQQSLGFEDQVRYLTGQHHMYLLPNPARHIDGGYGGSSATPPEGEAKEWELCAKFFSFVDAVVALARERGYKPGMPMLKAINIAAGDLKVPEEFAPAFREALATAAEQQAAERGLRVPISA